MTEPTLVHGWIDLTALIEVETILPASGAYLAIGLHVVPATVVSLAELPGPFTNADGDWLYHRVLPLMKTSGTNYPNTEGTYAQVSSVRVHDEVKSARKLHEDDMVSLIYEMVDADFGAQNSIINLLANFRYLLRQP